jgi:glycosyltransferase involved in cell wall biosynthesis
MRVLVATAHAAVVGGVETYLRAVLPRLRDRGVALGLLTAHPEHSGSSVREWVPDVPHRVASSPGEVVSAAEAFGPDVVYTHDLPDPAADDAFARRFPTVRFAHNYAGGCVSGTKCHAAPNWQACSRPLGPACLGLYLPRRCGGLNPISAVKLYRSNRTRQRTLARLRAVLVASRHMADEVIRNGAAAERVKVVPLFPPNAEPVPTPPEPRPRTDRVLFVGRLTPLKGWRELVSAIPVASARLGRMLKLVVVGDGPDRAAFESEVRRLNVACEFLGWLVSDTVIQQMRAADVLVVPSVWPEPFGLVGIEAGCVGLPTVAFATGGIPDWLTAGVSGEAAAGDRPRPQQLVDALVRALGDDTHHLRLRVGAWESARRFTADAHVSKLLAVFEQVSG